MSVFYKFTHLPLCDGSTHEGAIGKRNEDSYDFFRLGPGDPYSWEDDPVDSAYVAAVADGVTSKAAGANASTIAVETIRNAMRAAPAKYSIAQMLDHAFRAAHQAVTEVASQQPEFAGMSSTLVVTVIQNERLYVAHLGDSRAYLIRRGAVHRLTLDHSGIQIAIDNGMITEEEAKAHPNRHMILRHLAAKPFKPADQTIIQPGTDGASDKRCMVDSIALQPGDTIVLCTDGVTERVQSDEIAQITNRFLGQPDRIAKRLVRQALKYGEPDNITAVVLSMPTKWTWLRNQCVTFIPTTQRQVALFFIAGLALFASIYYTGSHPSVLQQEVLATISDWLTQNWLTQNWLTQLSQPITAVLEQVASRP